MFVWIWSLGPVVQLCFNSFHGQVCSLDQTNLDWCPAIAKALVRPVNKGEQRVVTVRDVSLQHNTGAQLKELRLRKHVHERLNGEFKVAELFHVEIYKSWGSR